MIPAPKFKIGDKVYRGYLTSDPPDCPTCHQPDYNADFDTYAKTEVRESIIVGLQIRAGVMECSDGVSYQLDTDVWLVDEESLHTTQADALEEITKEKEKRRQRRSENLRSL